MHQAKSLVSKDALISEILSRDKSEIESLRWIFSVDNNVAFQYFSNGGNDRYPINKIDLSVFLPYHGAVSNKNQLFPTRRRVA